MTKTFTFNEKELELLEEILEEAIDRYDDAITHASEEELEDEGYEELFDGLCGLRIKLFSK